MANHSESTLDQMYKVLALMEQRSKENSATVERIVAAANKATAVAQGTLNDLNNRMAAHIEHKRTARIIPFTPKYGPHATGK